MSAGSSSAGLPWPPLKDDLVRLYIEQRLSAAKIAQVYGLRYASPKTAESTILYHLKKNCIARRDPVEHIRKVTEEMADVWASRYSNGESLKQIAGDEVDPVTVFTHLHKRGLQLRDKVEAQIKAVTIHEKTSFQGSPADRAYLAGITRGDFWAGRHGRAVRVRLGTTHPDMAALFRQLFVRHGPIYEYPKLDTLTGYEWALDCDLDSSFEFLVQSKTNVSEFIRGSDLFMSFLAGFFDAEGSVYFHKKRGGGAFELALINTDEGLLRDITEELSRRGFAAKLERTLQNRADAVKRGISNPGEFIWRIMIWRFEDVCRLMKALPIRHSEKLAKFEIAIRLGYRPSHEVRERLLLDRTSLLTSIRKGRDAYVARAQAAYSSKEHRKSTTDSAK